MSAPLGAELSARPRVCWLQEIKNAKAIKINTDLFIKKYYKSAAVINESLQRFNKKLLLRHQTHLFHISYVVSIIPMLRRHTILNPYKVHPCVINFLTCCRHTHQGSAVGTGKPVLYKHQVTAGGST